MTKKPKPTMATPEPVKTAGAMSAGKAAYEQRRAAEAGLSLEAWLRKKARDAAVTTAPAAMKVPARKGLLTRLLDRAHKPLKG